MNIICIPLNVITYQFLNMKKTYETGKSYSCETAEIIGWTESAELEIVRPETSMDENDRLKEQGWELQFTGK